MDLMSTATLIGIVTAIATPITGVGFYVFRLELRQVESSMERKIQAVDQLRVSDDRLNAERHQVMQATLARVEQKLDVLADMRTTVEGLKAFIAGKQADV